MSAVFDLGGGHAVSRSSHDGVAKHQGPRVLREPVHRYSDLLAHSGFEHEAWREARVAELERQKPRTTTEERTRIVDELNAQLLSIARTIGRVYGTPDLGNKT